MKKLFYFLAIALVAATACEKKDPEPGPGPGPDPGPDPKPVTPTELVLKTNAIVDLGAESDIYTIKFSTNAAWTAELKNAEEGSVILGSTSGAAGEDINLKVTYQNIPEGIMGRMFDVVIKADDKEAKVNFFQGLVFDMVDAEEKELDIEGGEVKLHILTNMQYTIKTYEQFEVWAPTTIVKGDHVIDIAFKVAPNKGFDARTAYVKFLLPEVQVPVIDEETGEETGETEDLALRYYVSQKGTLKLGWVQQFTWAMFPESTRESIAEVGDYIVINCSKTSQGTGGALVFKKSDGSYVTTLDIPSLTGITNDDAGNLVLSAGGNYPIDPDTWALIPEQQVPLQLLAVTREQALKAVAGEAIEPKLLAEYYDGFYGYGLDNLRVTGDITKNAVITMCTSGGYGDFYAVDWEIVNGEFSDPGNGYTSYIALPNFLPDDRSMGIWSSFDIVAIHTGNTASSPMYYMGYDNNYNLQYLSGPGAEWKDVLVSGATWEDGFTSLALKEWNGHKYLAFVSVPYFAWADWDGDGAYTDHMPGHLWLVNIDDEDEPVVESWHEYYCDESNWQYGNSADVVMVIEGNDLVSYMVDAASSEYMKVIYPKP